VTHFQVREVAANEIQLPPVERPFIGCGVGVNWNLSQFQLRVPPSNGRRRRWTRRMDLSTCWKG
jgi:hypothetical protein